MATLTVTIDPTVLEAAEREAERRKVTLDQMVADYLATVAPPRTKRTHDNSELVRLMHESPLGDMGKPLTREEIYAERTWPRS